MTIQFAIQGHSYSDWYTITRTADNTFLVCRQGDGDYERFEADQQTVDRLKGAATSEII